MPDKPIIMSDSITHCSYCDEPKAFNTECGCAASKLARAERTIVRLNAQLADSKRLAGEQSQRAERAESQLAELTEPVPCDVELVRCATFTAAAIEDRGPWVSMAIHKRVKSELAAAREALVAARNGLKWARVGYLNILDLRHIVGTDRYGNLTRGEIMDAIAKLDAALAAGKE